MDAYEVKAQFGTQIDMVFDGGRAPGISGSTIVGLDGTQVKLIREGVIPYEEIMSSTEKKT